MIDPITADFVYIRLLGDRKAIEAKTTVWNQVLVQDKTASMNSWVDVCQMVQKRGIPQYVYFNNHYEGFAVASVERFRRLCAEKGIETPLNVQLPIAPTLFDISRELSYLTALSHLEIGGGKRRISQHQNDKRPSASEKPGFQ